MYQKIKSNLASREEHNLFANVNLPAVHTSIAIAGVIYVNVLISYCGKQNINMREMVI